MSDEIDALEKMAEAWVFMAKAETRLAEAGKATDNDYTHQNLVSMHKDMKQSGLNLRKALENSHKGEKLLEEASAEIAEWDDMEMSDDE
ncbi:hypothetical protein N0B31_18625 [Salinirubellus salinus]|uniref:Uncharacterized protein n=1 Tax=Salinirubellus salinus TaxID=1364945 RepID=A0A9E7R264_9EURY|nr:hypothetical protein [Salinirubellus salinus]UWM54118.1 hypothetical protein N0B31_18625 [Salinirubellus salinus]